MRNRREKQRMKKVRREMMVDSKNGRQGGFETISCGENGQIHSEKLEKSHDVDRVSWLEKIRARIALDFFDIFVFRVAVPA